MDEQFLDIRSDLDVISFKIVPLESRRGPDVFSIPVCKPVEQSVRKSVYGLENNCTHFQTSARAIYICRLRQYKLYVIHLFNLAVPTFFIAVDILTFK